jgi:hypothetical protein
LQDFDNQVRVHPPKNFRRCFDARDHAPFPRDNPAKRAEITAHKKISRDIAFAEIFPQSDSNRICAGVRHIG